MLRLFDRAIARIVNWSHSRTKGTHPTDRRVCRTIFSMPKNIIIVGPPRSGTSLTSGIFAGQGYFAGEQLRSGDDYNPFGYFEDEALVEANVRLFADVGFHFHNTWMFAPIATSQIEAISQLPIEECDRTLVTACKNHEPWMWKDPRLCMTLSYWAKLIDWTNAGVVLTQRNPDDVYWSFRRKGWCPAGNAHRLKTIERIENHAAMALESVHEFKLPHITIEYDEYHQRPGELAERINQFSGLELAAKDLNFHSELDHSSGRSRLAGHARILLKMLPNKAIKKVSAYLPKSVQALLFPERKFVSDDPIPNVTDPNDERRAA